MIIVKQPKTHFTVVPNGIIQNDAISASARMLWIYLASLPNNWQPRQAQLQNALGVGRDKVQGLCRELQEHGLLRRTVNRVEGGQVKGHIWQLLTGDRLPENQVVGGDRLPEKPSGGSSGPLESNELQKEKVKTSSLPKKSAKMRIARVLPEDWTPTERDVEFARQEGFEDYEIDRIANTFLDYWLSKGSGEKARKVGLVKNVEQLGEKGR